MGVYTVHMKGSPDDLSAIERTAFVREGFAWTALLFGPFWLIGRQLWLALLVWCLAQGAIIALDAYVLPSHEALNLLEILLALALGFEGGSIRRAALASRGYHFIDVVSGRRLADAERSLFGRALAMRTPDQAPIAMGQHMPGMIGLFPSAGG